jgi:tetratricopeptide (TPR) repeat protein
MHFRIALASALIALLTAAASTADAATEALPPLVAEVRTQLGANDLDAAVEAAERAVEELPQDARAWFWSGRAHGMQAMRANLLMKAKWAGRSREAYEKAVALDPQYVEARYDLMQYYLFAPGFLGGGREKADAEAAEIARRDVLWGKLASSALALADDDQKAAETALREALVAVPDSTRARLSLAGMLQRQERWDELRQLWRERVGKTPDGAMAQYQLGRAAAISGAELEDGLQHLDAFLAAGEMPEGLSIGSAHWRRGQVLDKLGRRDEAIKSLTLAVAVADVREYAQADLDRVVKRH